MKSLINFIKTTITGGVLFLLPITLLYIVIHKAYLLLGQIAQPLIERTPDLILGFSGARIVVLLLLLVLCFVSGLLFRHTITKKWIKKLEDNFICYLPGYTLMKSIAADALKQEVETKMIPVLVNDGDAYMIGFLTEEANGLCTVFMPGAPRHEEGEIKIFPSEFVSKINMPINTAVKSIKNFGKGLIENMPEPDKKN